MSSVILYATRGLAPPAGHDEKKYRLFSCLASQIWNLLYTVYETDCNSTLLDTSWARLHIFCHPWKLEWPSSLNWLSWSVAKGLLGYQETPHHAKQHAQFVGRVIQNRAGRSWWVGSISLVWHSGLLNVQQMSRCSRCAGILPADQSFFLSIPLWSSRFCTSTSSPQTWCKWTRREWTLWKNNVQRSETRRRFRVSDVQKSNSNWRQLTIQKPLGPFQVSHRRNCFCSSVSESKGLLRSRLESVELYNMHARRRGRMCVIMCLPI